MTRTANIKTKNHYNKCICSKKRINFLIIKSFGNVFFKIHYSIIKNYFFMGDTVAGFTPPDQILLHLFPAIVTIFSRLSSFPFLQSFVHKFSHSD